jgi:hypothetical protein
MKNICIFSFLLSSMFISIYAANCEADFLVKQKYPHAHAWIKNTIKDIAKEQNFHALITLEMVPAKLQAW